MEAYDEILQNIKVFCNRNPSKGFEIPYLENASELLDLYTKAGGILDEYGDENPELAGKSLKEILEQVKTLI